MRGPRHSPQVQRVRQCRLWEEDIPHHRARLIHPLLLETFGVANAVNRLCS